MDVARMSEEEQVQAAIRLSLQQTGQEVGSVGGGTPRGNGGGGTPRGNGGGATPRSGSRGTPRSGNTSQGDSSSQGTLQMLPASKFTGASLGFLVVLILSKSEADLAGDQAMVRVAAAIAKEVECTESDLPPPYGLAHLKGCALDGYDSFPTEETRSLLAFRDNFPEGGVVAPWIEVHLEYLSGEQTTWRSLSSVSEDVDPGNPELAALQDLDPIFAGRRVYASSLRVGSYPLDHALYTSMGKLPGKLIHLRESKDYVVTAGLPDELSSSTLQIDADDDRYLYSGNRRIRLSFCAGDATLQVSAIGQLKEGALTPWNSTIHHNFLHLVEVGSVELETMLQHFITESEQNAQTTRMGAIFVNVIAFILLLHRRSICSKAFCFDLPLGIIGLAPVGAVMFGAWLYYRVSATCTGIIVINIVLVWAVRLVTMYWHLTETQSRQLESQNYSAVEGGDANDARQRTRFFDDAHEEHEDADCCDDCFTNFTVVLAFIAFGFTTSIVFCSSLDHFHKIDTEMWSRIVGLNMNR